MGGALLGRQALIAAGGDMSGWRALMLLLPYPRQIPRSSSLRRFMLPHWF